MNKSSLKRPWLLQNPPTASLKQANDSEYNEIGSALRLIEYSKWN